MRPFLQEASPFIPDDYSDFLKALVQGPGGLLEKEPEKRLTCEQALDFGDRTLRKRLEQLRGLAPGPGAHHASGGGGGGGGGDGELPPAPSLDTLTAATGISVVGAGDPSGAPAGACGIPLRNASGGPGGLRTRPPPAPGDRGELLHRN